MTATKAISLELRDLLRDDSSGPPARVTLPSLTATRQRPTRPMAALKPLADALAGPRHKTAAERKRPVAAPQPSQKKQSRVRVHRRPSRGFE